MFRKEFWSSIENIVDDQIMEHYGRGVEPDTNRAHFDAYRLIFSAFMGATERETYLFGGAEDRIVDLRTINDGRGLLASIYTGDWEPVRSHFRKVALFFAGSGGAFNQGNATEDQLIEAKAEDRRTGIAFRNLANSLKVIRH